MSAVATVPGEARTIFFAVDSARLLSESHRFFRSVPDALTELVQNAYRARARHLTVTADQATRTITVADDGHGLDNPDRLVTLAGSGWQKDVVEPAGIGAFAVFGMAESVEIRSVFGHPRTCWSLAIGAEVLAAGLADQPLTVRTEVVDECAPSGLTVTLVLREDQPWPSLKEHALDWRHFFPLSMTLVVDGVAHEIDAPAIPAALRLETPVGRLSVLHGNGPFGLTPTFLSSHRCSKLLPVWEHRATAATLSTERLFGGAKPDARLNAIIKAVCPDHFMHSDFCSFIWEVDAASGVRPQLPDRNAMLEDEALHSALRVLRDFILAAVDVDGLTALFLRLAGDDRLITRSAFRERLAADPVAQAHRILGVVKLEELEPSPFLATAGYEVVSSELLPAQADFSLYREDEGWQCNCDHGGPTFYVRPTHRFAHPRMLVGLGETVGEASETAPATLRLACTDAKYVPELAMLLTTGLRVETLAGAGLRTLPAFWDGPGDTLLLEDVGLSVPGVTEVMGIVDVPAWETAFATLRQSKHFTTLAIAAHDAALPGGCELGEYVECEWNSYEINEGRLMSDALATVGVVLGGNAATVAAKVAHLESLRDEMMPSVLTPEQIERARSAELPDVLVEAMATLSAAQQNARAAFGLAALELDARLAA